LVFNEILKQSRNQGAKEAAHEELSSQDSDFEFSFQTTQLGMAILRSGLPPEEGLLVYLDLKQANQEMVLANELHQLYLLTPVSL